MKCKGCGGTDIEGGVPQERVDKIAEQRRQAREEAQAHLTKIGDLESDLATAQRELGQVETLQAKVQELEGERGRWGAEKALMAAGITDQEGIAIATAIYGTLPQDDRPPLEEWLASDQLPKGVRAYLPAAPPASSEGGAPAAVPDAPPPAEPPAAAEGAQPPPRPGLPPSSKGAHPAPPSSGPGFSAEQIRAMSRAEYAKNRDAIYAANQLRGGSSVQ